MRYFTPSSLKTGSLFAASVLFSVSVALTLTGCPTGGDLEDPDRFGPGGTGGPGPSDGCDVPAYFQQGCAGNICHDPGGPGGVDLISPGVEDRLVGVPATYDNVEVGLENCPTDNPELLIDPNDIENSLLLTKVLNQQACGYGMPMPYIAPPATEDLDCLRAWAQGLVDQANGAEAP